ncbi:MAG: hypothetical protein ACM3VT_03775, partial [Solirubrobacterales bacterium]
PVYLVGLSVYRMFERPWVLGGLCILAGYLGAWIGRQPRYDDLEFRRFLHRWQFRELARRLVGGRVIPATIGPGAINRADCRAPHST